MAAKMSVLGPKLSYWGYLRSAPGRFPLYSKGQHQTNSYSSVIQMTNNNYFSVFKRIQKGKVNFWTF